jgi:sugar (pentulose or hexulose) kinase
MKLDENPVLAQAATLLFMPDLFNYLFCGVRKSDVSIASTSQIYDPVRKQWAGELLEKMGISPKILPEIVPCGTVLGPLDQAVAKECDAGAVTVIAPAGHDTASAVAAVPAQGGDWCYLSSGTWSLLGVEIPEPIINDKSLKYNYTNESGVGGTIRFLKNIMGLWLVQECRRQWLREGREYSYAELTTMAAEAPALQSLVDPDHAPFAAPGDMPAKIEAYCKKRKQPVPSSPGEFVRTCLDSLALTYRLRRDGLEDLLGRKLRTLHIVGGGSQNELLNQMTADACNCTVFAGPVEATAAGNVLIQAMAVGEVRSIADIRSIVRESFPLKRYEPRVAREWELAYTRFREIIGS